MWTYNNCKWFFYLLLIPCYIKNATNLLLLLRNTVGSAATVIHFSYISFHTCLIYLAGRIAPEFVFLLGCGSFGQVWMQQAHSYQTGAPRLSWYAFIRTLSLNQKERHIFGLNQRLSSAALCIMGWGRVIAPKQSWQLIADRISLTRLSPKLLAKWRASTATTDAVVWQGTETARKFNSVQYFAFGLVQMKQTTGVTSPR